MGLGRVLIWGLGRVGWVGGGPCGHCWRSLRRNSSLRHDNEAKKPKVRNHLQRKKEAGLWRADWCSARSAADDSDREIGDITIVPVVGEK